MRKKRDLSDLLGTIKGKSAEFAATIKERKCRYFRCYKKGENVEFRVAIKRELFSKFDVWISQGKTKNNSVKKPAKKVPQIVAHAKLQVTQKTTQNYTNSTKAELRKIKVAEGVSIGKTEKQIAAEIGISRDRVAQIKAEPSFPATLTAMLAPHREKYEEIFRLYLESMVDLMGDTYPANIRLQAIDRFYKLIMMTQPKKGAVSASGITLEELERRVKESKGPRL